MNVQQKLRYWIRHLGYDIQHFSHVQHSVARRAHLVKNENIELVLDIGANHGQYAMGLRRELGYRGDIISFEPLNSAFEQLKKHAQGDQRWLVRNLGLGDKSETLLINIAGNSYSSSFLNMLPRHVEAAPDSAYIGQQEISVTTLDSIFSEVAGTARNIFMKIDTQGFERRVMQGALTSLPRIAMIQLEMSLVPLYEEELGLVDMLTYMSNLGYRLIALEPGFTDPRTAHLLQADGIFLRAEPTSATRQ